MAVKFVSKSKEKVATSTSKWTVVQELVERLHQLKVALDPVQKEFKEKQTKLKLMIPTDAAEDKPVLFEGVNHNVEFSACADERVVLHPELVFKFLGEELAMKLVQFKLGDLDKYLTPEQKEQILATMQTGPRVMKIKEKA